MILSLAAVASLAFAAPAGTETVSKSDRFSLWNDCKPVDLTVQYLHKEAADIGLTREEVEAAVRSRLRAARLYDPDEKRVYLNVQVSVLGVAFGIDLSLMKIMIDLVSGEHGFAATERIRIIGINGQGSGYVLSNLSKQMDQFIDEYLRVNASACKR